jgi:excisionase family DNA binding protein
MPADSMPASRSNLDPNRYTFAGFQLGRRRNQGPSHLWSLRSLTDGGRDVYCQCRWMSTSNSASNSNDAIDSRPTDLGETGDQRSTDLGSVCSCDHLRSYDGHKSSPPVPPQREDCLMMTGDDLNQLFPARSDSLAAPLPLVLTVEQSAERLGVGRTVMYALVSSGAVESVQIGRLRRIPADALVTFLNELRAGRRGGVA